MTIEPHRLTTAEQFLAALHPREPNWGEAPRRWLFRGQADAQWPLLPAAFRREAWDELAPFDPDVADENRVSHELSMLRLFAEQLNEAGIEVPGLGLIELDDINPLAPLGDWPHTFVELAALAQHHEIPTRLLDFTQDARVAAYFAAQRPGHKSLATHLGVWAIDSHFLIAGGKDYEGLWLSIEHALRASNRNLHAQSGLFITWTGDTRLTPLNTLIANINRGNLRSQDGAVSSDACPIRWFTLPRTEADRLLGLLAYESIDAAHLFPGVHGVVRQLRDLARHGVYAGRPGSIAPPWKRG